MGEEHAVFTTLLAEAELSNCSEFNICGGGACCLYDIVLLNLNLNLYKKFNIGMFWVKTYRNNIVHFVDIDGIVDHISQFKLSSHNSYQND